MALRSSSGVIVATPCLRTTQAPARFAISGDVRDLDEVRGNPVVVAAPEPEAEAARAASDHQRVHVHLGCQAIAVAVQRLVSVRQGRSAQLLGLDLVE